MAALDLTSLVDPAHTAIVTSEVQNGVVGERSALPALAEAAGPMIDRLAVLLAAARPAGVRVIHATAARRADAAGSNTNARAIATRPPSRSPRWSTSRDHPTRNAPPRCWSRSC